MIDRDVPRADETYEQRRARETARPARSEESFGGPARQSDAGATIRRPGETEAQYRARAFGAQDDPASTGTSYQHGTDAQRGERDAGGVAGVAGRGEVVEAPGCTSAEFAALVARVDAIEARGATDTARGGYPRLSGETDADWDKRVARRNRTPEQEAADRANPSRGSRGGYSDDPVGDSRSRGASSDHEFVTLTNRVAVLERAFAERKGL